MKLNIILLIVITIIIIFKFLYSNNKNIEKYNNNYKEYKNFLNKNLKCYELENIKLKRFGPKYDGGYILCENLIKNKTDVVYSYGVQGNDPTSCNISSKYNLDIYLFDCFNTTQPQCNTKKKYIFNEECIGNKKEIIDGKKFNTYVNQINKNNHRKKKILLLMDIEGGEYDSLLGIPINYLKNISQLSLEIHWFLDEIGDPKYNFLMFKKLILHLKKVFYVAHIHCNNNSCQKILPCDVIEVLFINKKYTKPTNKLLNLPLSIDYPNSTGFKDCHWKNSW